MLKRKIYDKIARWKTESNGRSALLIEGARRVGKSKIVEFFAKQEYRSHIVVDFAKPKEGIVEAITKRPDDLDGLFNLLTLSYGVKLFKRESVIVFDEVQLCPPARQLIKYLVEDGRYDYIETGSLISLKRNVEKISIPSEEEILPMYPMDFEEFCWAMGDELTVPFAREAFERMQPLGQAAHATILRRYREYLAVGGMPQAVNAYLAERDFSQADHAKRLILKLYADDISKYAGADAPKVRGIFNQIPGQLAKKEKRYFLTSVNADARMREYAESFRWLDESRTVNIARNASDPDVALAMSADYDTQKLYSSDTGLLVTQAFMDAEYTENELYKALMLDKLSINNGMLAENAVAQALRASGRELYFYSRYGRDETEQKMEIDFLIRREGKISPIEVKSAAYQHHASLDKFIQKFSNRLGTPYILYTKDVMRKNGIVHLPLYMAPFLCEGQR